jgi:hypothetical protein
MESAKTCMGLYHHLPSILLAKSFLRMLGDKNSLEGSYLILKSEALSAFFTGSTGLCGQVRLAVIPEEVVETNEVAAGHDGLSSP